MQARRGMMFVNGQPWAKKGGEVFDIGMGSFDGAECCEIVGLFLLEELSELGVLVGIYRDDGLCVSDRSAQEVEEIKKQMSAIFRKYDLEITVIANKRRVEFLDVYLDLEKNEYGPYRKEGDTPIYVSRDSNHPRQVLENIPRSINNRLTRISCNEQIFNKDIKVYQDALTKSGHTHTLKYQPEEVNSASSVPKRNRSRKAIFFNPPFSKDVKTNVGQKFLQIMDKYFPKGNPLNKIFNRNSVKMSYRCTANLGQKISAHNAKILKVSTVQEVDPKTCNCRNRNLCPLENKCLTKCCVYQAVVTRVDGVVDSYVGLTENTFKDRWTKHKSSFRTRNPKNASGLSRYIWKLEDDNIGYKLEWRVISQAKPFDPASGVCRLCIREKYFITFKPHMSTINSRNEIAGPCLHKASRLIGKK